MGHVKLEHVEARLLRHVRRTDKLLAHSVHVAPVHRLRHLAVRVVRERGGREKGPVAVGQRLVDPLPESARRAFATSMGELERDPRRARRVDEIDDALPGSAVLGLVHSRAAGRDPPLTAHVGHLCDDERGASDRARAEVHEVPVAGRAVLGRVLAHRRDHDPVREQHVTQPERREHGRWRQRRRRRDAALPLGLGGEPAVNRGHKPRVTELQVVVSHAQAPRQETHGELDGLETERYHGRLEPIQFAMSLLTRSLRVTHDNLKLRDPRFVATVDRWFASQAERQSRVPAPAALTPPPMFTPFRLRDMLLANRIVVSPMCQYSAEDGTPGDWHLVNLGSRAVGGAALVIAEMTDVSREGRITPGCTGMYKPEHRAAWKRIVDFVHAASPARIALQLAHAGRKGSTRRLWEGIDEPLPDGNWPLLSASALPYHPYSQVPKAMDRSDMDAVREQFVRAADMAEQAGFDMLELHVAHGYLLASFISPLTNVRTDEYGGSLENRARYPLEVLDAVRAVWPRGKPMSVKISATDWIDGGLGPDDAVGLARLLREHGCDIVTVSTGQTVPDQKPVYGRLYQTPFSDRIRCEAGIATMTVGNIASYDDVNSILAAGRADLCVLARGHLYDPYWTRHAAYEQGWDLPWPDQYVSVKSFTPRRG